MKSIYQYINLSIYQSISITAIYLSKGPVTYQPTRDHHTAAALLRVFFCSSQTALRNRCARRRNKIAFNFSLRVV